MKYDATGEWIVPLRRKRLSTERIVVVISFANLENNSCNGIEIAR